MEKQGSQAFMRKFFGLMECDQSEPSCHKQRHWGWFGVLDPDSCISKRLLTPVCLHNVGGGAQLCGPAVDLLFLANLSQTTLLNSDVLIGLGQRIMTVMSYNLKWIQARHFSFFCCRCIVLHCCTVIADYWCHPLCVCMEASSQSHEFWVVEWRQTETFSIVSWPVIGQRGKVADCDVEEVKVNCENRGLDW